MPLMPLETTAITWDSVIQAMTAQVSVANVVAVLAALVTAGIGFAWMWWGVRKGVSSLAAAWKRGKIRL